MLPKRKDLLLEREDGNHMNETRVCVQIQQVQRGSPVELVEGLKSWNLFHRRKVETYFIGT